MSRVVVSGIGVLGPLGAGAAAFWDALCAGRSAIAPIRGHEGFPTPAAPPRLAAEVAEVPARDFIPAALVRRMDRVSRMIGVVAAMAAADAGVAAGPTDDLAVVVGSALGNLAEAAQFVERVFTRGPSLANPMLFPNLVLNAPASQVSMALGWRGPNLTVSAGEISGEAAVETAVGLLRRGRARGVVVAAGEELSPVLFAALVDLGVLSPRGAAREWSSPFDVAANGPVVGEGAAALFLEAEAEAAARGRSALAVVGEVRGFALDAPSPYAWPPPAAPLEAIAARAPDLVISGADSSPERDLLEISLVGAAPAPVVSLKGAIGEHGGQGLVGVAAAALAIATGRIPPMPALERLRAEARFEPPRAALARVVRRAVVLGVARGGAGITVALEAP